MHEFEVNTLDVQMHLVPKSQLYGLPAVAVRDFLRRGALVDFDEAEVRSRLKLSDAQAKCLVYGLLADGLIEHSVEADDVHHYAVTSRGLQLAMASFAPQITRAVGEQLLAGVIARATDTESQRHFVSQVSKVAVFGSMLGASSHVSDVDIAVETTSRLDNSQLRRVSQERIDIATQQGKRFRNKFALAQWPHTEVVEYLKGGSRYISTHSFRELEQLQCPFRVVLVHPMSSS